MTFVFSGHDLRKWERLHAEWGHNNSREFIKAVVTIVMKDTIQLTPSSAKAELFLQMLTT